MSNKTTKQDFFKYNDENLYMVTHGTDGKAKDVRVFKNHEITPDTVVLSENVYAAVVAAYSMQQIGQEVEYIHQKNLAKAKIRQLMKELDMQEVDLSIHEMD